MEAKEGVEIKRETQTYATITIQNYFRLYDKLAGMTGTAETEAGEFLDIYKLGVLVTQPIGRWLGKMATIQSTNHGAKYQAAIEEIKHVHQQGRPILVGTI